MRKLAAALLVGVASLAVGGGTAAADTSGLPHCAVEDGGPQPVCIWDSAVDGNGQPAPDNVVILYVTRPGEDPIGYRLK
jgi:hypothetical protein